MIERVWRIINVKTDEYIPAPRNTMGVYATERGARAGLTQLRKNYWAKTEELEIRPFLLMSEDDYERSQQIQD